jgi:DnaJ-class molecular chaperone
MDFIHIRKTYINNFTDYLYKMPNHYETLGVSKDASEKDIKQAFRAMSMRSRRSQQKNARNQFSK